MNRPEIRIIQDQQEEIGPADISQNEKEMLLAKYGYKPQTINDCSPDSGLSFEEMIRQEELKNQQTLNQFQNPTSTRPYTFGGRYESDTIYGTDADTGYTFKINIVSDMPIPKQ